MRVARLAGVLVVAVVLLALYVRVGWDRMEAACSADPPGAPVRATVEHGWSWTPPGFTCTYDDGTTRRSLWF